MDYRVTWSPTALDDVDAIAEYINRDSPAYTRAVVNKILDTSRKLEVFPNAGHIVPEFDDDEIREHFSIQLSDYLPDPEQRSPHRCRSAWPTASGAAARSDQRCLMAMC